MSSSSSEASSSDASKSSANKKVLNLPPIFSNSLTLDEDAYCGLNEILLSDGDDCVVFTQKDLAANAFPVMEDVRRAGKLCDVTIRVGENVFHAHRIVLAATIPYFHAMFTHDMAEAKQREISILGVEPSSMETLINFAYRCPIMFPDVKQCVA